MAVYSYIVINNQGKEKKGSLEAETIEEVKSILRVDGNIPISVYEQGVFSKDISLTIGKKVKSRELCIFCRQFASLMSAGVIMTRALDMLSRNTQNKSLASALNKLQLSVIRGETLGDSMRDYDNIFPSFMINMVKAGEASGSLDSALIRLADYFEKEASAKSQVKKAMIYPITILVVMVIVIFLMMMFVVPNFSEMFAGIGTDLPVLTQMIVNISNFFVKRWYLIIGIIIAFIVGIRFFRRTPTGKSFFGKLALSLPLFGSLIIKSSASRFASSISTLVSTGISMVEALDITARIMDNTIVRQAIYSVREDVSKGSVLSEPLASVNVFPPMLSEMIAIGEETGEIDGMLNNLAAYYDEEVKVATEALLAVLQPLIIIIMAGIVGILLAAMMSPIIKMYQILDQV